MTFSPTARPCVEVIRCGSTDDATVAAVEASLEATGKTAVVLQRPVPGFLFSRRPQFCHFAGAPLCIYYVFQ